MSPYNHSVAGDSQYIGPYALVIVEHVYPERHLTGHSVIGSGPYMFREYAFESEKAPSTFHRRPYLVRSAHSSYGMRTRSLAASPPPRIKIV